MLLPSIREGSREARKIQHKRQERSEEEESMGSTGKVVCVTGASGYIASWIVKLLLQRGYTVRASVRDPSQCFLCFHMILFVVPVTCMCFGSVAI